MNLIDFTIFKVNDNLLITFIIIASLFFYDLYNQILNN